MPLPPHDRLLYNHAATCLDAGGKALSETAAFDVPSAAGRLREAGMSPADADAKARMLARCAVSLAEGGADIAAAAAMFVPGRLEVLGTHTDYAGGRSVTCPVEQGFALLSAPRGDSRMRLIDAARGETAEFAVAADLAPIEGHWSRYPMAVARRLARNFPGPLRGADAAFASDLPPAAGMSSSSALVIASYLAMNVANDFASREPYRANLHTREDLAAYLATMENGQSFGTLLGDRGVGTFGGSEDHTAILCGVAGRLSCYRYCPVQMEKRIALPEGYVFAIAASGVAAAKTGDAREKYNRASLLAYAVLSAWNTATGRDDPHLAAAMESAPDAAERMRAALRIAHSPQFTAPALLRRFDHFAAESHEIIPAACAALERGDVAEFGRQCDRSQEIAETLLANQVPQTIHLARSARRLGAAAARSFGAGFGGAVWALLRLDDAEALLAEWSARYRAEHPDEAARARFFLTRPGPPAVRAGG
jgi:galactokinase